MSWEVHTKSWLQALCAGAFKDISRCRKMTCNVPAHKKVEMARNWMGVNLRSILYNCALRLSGTKKIGASGLVFSHVASS